MRKKTLYIQLFSIHGLIRGSNVEMGKNADTGGQVKYVLELARALGKRDDIRKVDLFTRLIRDKTLSPDYHRSVEPLDEKLRIVRIPCGGGKYIRKELLWPHLDEYMDKALKFIKQEDDIPDLIHGHYADGGYVAKELTTLLGLPFLFTGHSLGRVKKQRLHEEGVSDEEMNKKYRIDQRIEVEEEVISNAELIIASTNQEMEAQYGLYQAGASGRYSVIPPGIDLYRFFPFYDESLEPIPELEEKEQIRQAQFYVQKELERFLTQPEKPLILALSRPDRRKNIRGLVTAYGTDKELQAIANLAVFAGIRKDISKMDDNEREVLTELLLLMDKYDLYGKLAIPKRHEFDYEVPELYRMTARTQGVFVNPAFNEPFGLTLIEAAASGLPIVATNDGGPRDILGNCRNGVLVDVNDPQQISSTLKRILVDPELWKEYSQNGLQRVREHYSWEAHSNKYIKQIKKLTTGKKTQMAVAPAGGATGKRLAKLDRLFITDIDDTLVGDEESLGKLCRMLQENRQQIGFGVATGRTVDSVCRLLEKRGIPHPDIIISSVGSEIYYGPNLMPDRGWQAHLSFRWERERIQETLAELDFLVLQEADAQRRFKLSYYMPEEPDNLAQVHFHLTERRLRYNLIYSSSQFMDVLPYRASKGKAVRYLHYKWNIPLHRILAAGDSGNDEDMLRGELLGVVVSNYTPELAKLRGLKRVYFASASHAAGILEGFRHYRILEEPA